MPRFKLVLASILMTLLAVPAASAPQWMGEAYPVGDIYTYGEDGVLAVFLEGQTCRNQKDYFFITPAQVNNASQLIAMILAAKAAGQRVRFYEQFDLDTQHCYVKGVWIKD